MPVEARNVLVTGGAGYIGSHACRALAQAGYLPIVYDNLVNGHRAAVRWGPLEHGDVTDRSRLDDVLRTYKPSAIIHFAGFAYVGESVLDPGKYYRNNVIGTLTLLEAARDNHIPRFVFSSSCAIYGIPDNLPVAVGNSVKPISPYGASKAHSERIIADFGAAHGLHWTALRYFNAAVAEPDGSNGERHIPETRIIPLAIDAALGFAEDLTVYGDTYDTPDGTCVRDYVHVCDLANAHVAALRYLDNGAPSRAFNLGSGEGSSVLDVIRTVESVTGRAVPRVIADQRPGDPPILLAETEESSRVLDWRPQLSSLEQIVETDCAWRRNLPRDSLPRAVAVRSASE